jgi:hypothetical protein
MSVIKLDRSSDILFQAISTLLKETDSSLSESQFVQHSGLK